VKVLVGRVPLWLDRQRADIHRLILLLYGFVLLDLLMYKYPFRY
jgi:hypothetical protein